MPTVYEVPSFEPDCQWTRFDEFDKKLLHLRTEVHQFNHECHVNYETSEHHYSNIKDYVETVKIDFQNRIQWAMEANQHYSDLLKDFTNYKQETNKEITA